MIVLIKPNYFLIFFVFQPLLRKILISLITAERDYLVSSRYAVSKILEKLRDLLGADKVPLSSASKVSVGEKDKGTVNEGSNKSNNTDSLRSLYNSVENEGSTSKKSEKQSEFSARIEQSIEE